MHLVVGLLRGHAIPPSRESPGPDGRRGARLSFAGMTEELSRSRRSPLQPLPVSRKSAEPGMELVHDERRSSEHPRLAPKLLERCLARPPVDIDPHERQ
jgi:hypothetical protein